MKAQQHISTIIPLSPCLVRAKVNKDASAGQNQYKRILLDLEDKYTEFIRALQRCQNRMKGEYDLLVGPNQIQHLI